MSGADAQAQRQERVEALIADLEAAPDAPVTAAARELVGLVLELHGAGLARLLELASAAAGPGLLAVLAADEAVGGLLLLHDLHPLGLEARVRAATERLHPHLGVAGLALDDLRVADGVVRLRLRGGPGRLGQAHQVQALRRELEEAVLAAAPEVREVRVDGLIEPSSVTGSVTYVPVASLARRPRLAGQGALP
jgi:hypothetical protein